MAMHAVFEIKDPKKIEATITISASVGDFLEMAEQVKSLVGHSNVGWPLCQLTSAISDVVSDARQHFYKYSDNDKPTA
jgi:hypothetical protein